MFNKYLGLCLILTVVMTCYGDTNILTNGGFEKGVADWSGRGCQIEAAKEPVHGGSGSVKVYDRAENWQGIKQPVMGKMMDGEAYQISGWVRLENADSNNVIVSVEQSDDGGTHYINVGKVTATNGEWVEVTGQFTLDVDGTLTTLDVYFEGPDAGVNFFVDDVSVYGPSPSEAADANDQ